MQDMAFVALNGVNNSQYSALDQLREQDRPDRKLDYGLLVDEPRLGELEVEASGSLKTTLAVAAAAVLVVWLIMRKK